MILAGPGNFKIPEIISLIVGIQAYISHGPFAVLITRTTPKRFCGVVHHKLGPSPLPSPSIIHVAGKSRRNEIIIIEGPFEFLIGLQYVSAQVVVPGPAMDTQGYVVIQVVDYVYVSSSEVESSRWFQRSRCEEDR